MVIPPIRALPIVKIIEKVIFNSSSPKMRARRNNYLQKCIDLVPVLNIIIVFKFYFKAFHCLRSFHIFIIVYLFTFKN